MFAVNSENHDTNWIYLAWDFSFSSFVYFFPLELQYGKGNARKGNQKIL